MPLHRCDIYGSKRAGQLLKKALTLGSSVHFSEILKILSGTQQISTNAFFEYYLPLLEWLKSEVVRKNIPIGW